MSKQAGVASTLDVELSIINETAQTAWARVCTDSLSSGNCHDTAIAPHTTSVTNSWDRYGVNVSFSAGGLDQLSASDIPLNGASFDVSNPTFGEPYFALETLSTSFEQGFSAGESKDLLDADGHDYRMERRGDSENFKLMRFILLAPSGAIS